MAKGATIQRIATPTAILVGLPEDLAAECTEALSDGGLKVLKVGHVAAACERIPVVMPQLVLTTSALHAHDAETLNDRCVAVGAEIIKVAPDQDRRELAVQLKNAANMADPGASTRRLSRVVLKTRGVRPRFGPARTASARVCLPWKPSAMTA